MRDIEIDFFKYRNISSYEPTIGDLIIKHGWIFRRTVWFGYVIGVNKDEIRILKASLPSFFCSFGNIEKDKNSIILSIHSIKNSIRNTYSIFQWTTGGQICYV